MSWMKSVQESIRYAFEAALRLFSPTDDAYPNVGVRPLEGDSAKESQWVE